MIIEQIQHKQNPNFVSGDEDIYIWMKAPVFTRIKQSKLAT